MKPEITKRYIGIASNEGLDNVRVTVIYDGQDTNQYVLPLHLEIVNHSPTGFAWGYGGSGPSQLALAICFDYLLDMRGDKETAQREALEIYQLFKQRVIARLDKDANFVLTTRTVALEIERIEQNRRVSQ